MELVNITLRWFFLLFLRFVVEITLFIFILALKSAPIHFQLRSMSLYSPMSNYLDTGDLSGGGRLIKLFSDCC